MKVNSGFGAEVENEIENGEIGYEPKGVVAYLPIWRHIRDNEIGVQQVDGRFIV